MKIVKLSFRNLNSLQGDFTLDFDRGPLGRAGIFAITGPTGAGKSTILDAICVALFGRTPRLESGASEEMMTRHTADCRAEVTFRVSSGLYRSGWSLRRARNRPDGKAQPVRMELVQLEGEVETIIEERKSRIVARIEELTGLDFSRFTRSILLAQGGFAAFLNADDTARADLLEKMTGTEIYSQISQAVFLRYREEEGKLERGRQQLDSRNLLDGEGEKLLAAAEAAKAAAVEEEKEEGVRVEAMLAWHGKHRELTATVGRGRQELAELGAELRRRQPEMARLSAAEKALPLRASYAVLTQFGQQRAGLAQKCRELGAELPLLAAAAERLTASNAGEERDHAKFLHEGEEREELLRRVEQTDLRLDDALAACKLRQEKLQAVTADLVVLGEEVEGARREMARLEARREECLLYAQERAADARLEAELPLIAERLQLRGQLLGQQGEKEKEAGAVCQLLAALAEAELQGQRAAAECEAAMAREAALLGQRQEDYELLAAAGDGEESAAELGRREGLQRAWAELEEVGRGAEETRLARGREMLARQEAERELAAAREQGRAGAAELRAAEALLQQLEEERTLALLLANHEEARRHLTAGQPCPLCGSPDHPWAAGGQPGGEGSLAALAAQQGRLAALRRALEQAQERINARQTELALRGQSIAALARAEEQLGQRWSQLGGACQWPGSLENWRELEAARGELARELAAGRQRLRRMKELQEALAGHHLALRDWERQGAELALARQKTQGEQEAAGARRDYLAAELRGLGAQGEAVIAQLLPLLLSYREELPAAGREEELLGRLRRRGEKMAASRRELAELEARLNELRPRLAAWASRREAGVARHGEEEKLLAAARAAWEKLRAARLALLGERRVAEEREQLRAAARGWAARRQRTGEALGELAAKRKHKHELLLATQEEEAAKVGEEAEAGRAFAQALQAAGFTDAALFRAALLGDDERRRLEEARRLLGEEEAAIKARLAEAEPRLLALAAAPVAEAWEAVLARQAGQRARLAAGQEELGAIREKVRQQAELRRQAEELLNSLAGQEREYQRWQKLNELIGSADGKKFRRFAQGLTLDYLIGLANAHLAKLNDRYLLRRHDREELGLEVIDSYQANVTRPATTLSGGESFLASLALALGLSGLAARQTSIDSLFLDEGFGSLDSETLEVALTALDGLHSSGKTIGIISHVEALKERIPVQIQVRKRAGGISELEVVGG